MAGELLLKYPVTDDWFYDEPWTEWLGRETLTRHDGLWLGDGLNRSPLEVKTNLLERHQRNLVLTGSREKLLSLVGLQHGLKQEVVVDGSWSSPDNISVHVTSALVTAHRSKRLALRLLKEKPFFVYLISYADYTNDTRRVPKDYVPWILEPSTSAGLDGHDPRGVIDAVRRPQFSGEIVRDFGLHSADPFGQVWRYKQKIAARSTAWAEPTSRDEPNSGGRRLTCSARFLKTVLGKRNAELLILIRLQRYEKEEYSNLSSRFSNTIAVVRIDKNLKTTFHRGAVNYIQNPHSNA